MKTPPGAAWARVVATELLDEFLVAVDDTVPALHVQFAGVPPTSLTREFERTRFRRNLGGCSSVYLLRRDGNRSERPPLAPLDFVSRPDTPDERGHRQGALSNGVRGFARQFVTMPAVASQDRRVALFRRRASQRHRMELLVGLTGQLRLNRGA